jgi:phosphoribosyl 1,2-cyclic phosphodiesterase
MLAQQNGGLRMELKFWGVRGSIPTPAPENLGFGGNTTCLEVRLGNGDVVIIDGGTGARKLGLDLLQRSAGQSLNLNLLMTHFHWDHIQGIPFFAPLYSPANHIRFLTTKPAEEVRNILEGQMTHPYFPVAFDLLAAKREFHSMDGKIGQKLCNDMLTVHSFPLNHPQGASGYRMESGGAVIVHACDHEHGDPVLDKTIREYAEGADVLVYDAQFTPEEYPSKKGWGHSTWMEGIQVARDAGVKQLVLAHHDPSHTDEFMRGVLEAARQHFDQVIIAREGSSVVL